MKQLEGYIQEDKENKVYLLKKSLYGLKHSSRRWYKRFDSFMIKAKYNRCEYDSCVNFKQRDDPIYLLLYVDDMLIVVRNETHIQKLKAQLKKKFDMKDLREAKKILGMEITRYKGSGRLWLSQEKYLLKVLKRFNMAKTRLVITTWQVTSDYPLSNVHNHQKRRRRCLEYHVLVWWDHSCMLQFALGLTQPMQLVQ